MWVPPDSEYIGLHRADTSAAAAAGLRCRPVTETVVGTWNWLRHLAEPPVRVREGMPAPGLDPAKERRVLEAWRDAGRTQRG